MLPNPQLLPYRGEWLMNSPLTSSPFSRFARSQAGRGFLLCSARQGRLTSVGSCYWQL